MSRGDYRNAKEKKEVNSYEMKCRSLSTTCFIAACIGLSLAAASAKPVLRVRRSGVSDQRLAELETIVALAKSHPEILVDIEDIGKRKRSIHSENHERFYPVDFGSGKYDHNFQDAMSNFLATVRRKRDIRRDG